MHLSQYPSLQCPPPLLKPLPPLRRRDIPMPLGQIAPHLQRHKHPPEQIPRLRAKLQPPRRRLAHPLQRLQDTVEALHKIGRMVRVCRRLGKRREEMCVDGGVDECALSLVRAPIGCFEDAEFLVVEAGARIVVEVQFSSCGESESSDAVPFEQARVAGAALVAPAVAHGGQPDEAAVMHPMAAGGEWEEG